MFPTDDFKAVIKAEQPANDQRDEETQTVDELVRFAGEAAQARHGFSFESERRLLSHFRHPPG